jgi:hypothetical protein
MRHRFVSLPFWIGVLALAVVGGAACSKHEPRKQFGVVTEEGLAAVRAWCQGELERRELARGDPESPSGRHIADRDKIEYRCFPPRHVEHRGPAFLVIDAHTDRPLRMSLEMSLRELDALAPTLLFPVFDPDHHRAYEAMRQYIGSEEAVAAAHRDAYETRRNWTRGKTYLAIGRYSYGAVHFSLGVQN